MKIKSYRKITQELFDHMVDEHGLILLESELDDIFNICRNKILPKIHIVKRKSKWAIKINGRKIAYRILNSQQEAIDYCYSKFKFRTIVIHNHHGEIEKVIYI